MGKKFANHISDKGLPPRITATTQHKDNPIKTRATDISAKHIKMANEHMKR